MATRSLTDVFTLMRNNAIQNRSFYNDQRLSDRAALVEEGLEFRTADGSNIPPAWADYLEETQYSVNRLNVKIDELDNLHKKNLHRPTLDDSSEDQHQIEGLTREISRMFFNCHKLVDTIKRQGSRGSISDRKLAENVMSTLATSLQNSSVKFRTTQNNYLRTLKSREERSEQYFSTSLNQEYDTWQMDDDIANIDRAFGMAPSQTMSQQQMMMLEEENTRLAVEREEEVRQIVKSIVDLNEIFKDLATMVSDQGTVLDRIDYNIEKTSVQVQHGYQQLQKASAYQHEQLWQEMTKLKSMIVDLSANVRAIKGKLDADGDRMTEVDSEMNDVLAMLPLASMAEFSKLEKQLKENKALPVKVVNFFISFGGQNEKNLCLNIMKRLFSDQLATEFSFTGKKGIFGTSTKPFHSTMTCKMVVDAVKKTYSKSTDDIIKKVIMSFLNHAKTRIIRKEQRHS